MFEEIKAKLEKQYYSSLQNSLDYEKAFGRYLVVGSGAAIIFILSSYLSADENSLLLSGKFDLPLWLFTFSVLLGALNVYLSMTLGSRYASTFLYVQGLISQYEMQFSKNYISEDRMKIMLSDFGEQWKSASKIPRPFQIALNVIRILTALTFSVGLVLSIFYVTSFYG